MWIKTADRLPENEQIVLLMMRRTGYRIAENSDKSYRSEKTSRFFITIGFYEDGNHMLNGDKSILNNYNMSYRDKSSVVERTPNGSDRFIKQGWFEVVEYSKRISPIDVKSGKDEVIAWSLLPDMKQYEYLYNGRK